MRVAGQDWVASGVRSQAGCVPAWHQPVDPVPCRPGWRVAGAILSPGFQPPMPPMPFIRPSSLIVLALLPGLALACGDARTLKGVVSVPSCDPDAPNTACMPGPQAVYEAMQAFDMPGVFSIGLQTSPWRMYDDSGRILQIEDVAAVIRDRRPESDTRVRLLGSWTAARPDGEGFTLAQRLSQALDGFPVDGSDGFLWMSPAGATRTTQQAYTTRESGPYEVRANKRDGGN